MKTKLFLFLLPALAIVATAQDAKMPPSQDSNPPAKVAHNATVNENFQPNEPKGRFQIVSGQTWLVTATGSSSVPVMLKLDTQTGRTWMLLMENNGTNSTLAFGELPDIAHLPRTK